MTSKLGSALGGGGVQGLTTAYTERIQLAGFPIMSWIFAKGDVNNTFRLLCEFPHLGRLS